MQVNAVYIISKEQNINFSKPPSKVKFNIKKVKGGEKKMSTSLLTFAFNENRIFKSSRESLV